MAPMVEIKNLNKHFGPFKAVDNVSFNVGPGEVLGFLGPNGAGKSTTMKMISGFLAPDGGTVIIDGHDIAQEPVKVKRRLGYLPEGAPAYQDMTPASYLAFIADIRGLRGDEKHRRITDTVDKVNLETVLYQPIETLSKGFKRRVGLAQAILHDPEVLILDEPTDGLDPNQKHEVRTLITQMAQEKAIILSTHILEEVDAVCTRAVIIAGGRLVADGTPAELEARSPLHNAVTLGVRGANDKTVKNALSALPDVKRVEILDHTDDAVRLRLYPAGDRAVVTDVSHLAREQQWEVAELHVHSGRLDEVFRTITATEQALT